eukprot:8830221-Heterocapsa_arctica.AAC.1
MEDHTEPLEPVAAAYLNVFRICSPEDPAAGVTSCWRAPLVDRMRRRCRDVERQRLGGLSGKAIRVA